MKQKLKEVAIAVILCTGIFLFTQIALPTPDHLPTTQEPTPTASQPLPANNPSTSRNNVQTNTNTKNQSNKESIAQKSEILQRYPEITEIPYHLLGSVSDPYYSSTWSLTKVQANRAWDLTTGSDATVVAVIDTGFALDHEELVGKWQLNSDEIGLTVPGEVCWTGTATDKQTNNCDDDQNGYIDDWRGYDFFYDDNSPQAGEVDPSSSETRHGTAVAGVIAATGNNGNGTVGIDQQTKIMPLQVFSDSGEATTTNLVTAIEYAVNNGADVVNLSLGTNKYDSPLLDIIRYATTNNVVVVAASGNCALNDQEFCNSLTAPGRMTFPALYTETISVGATSSTDYRANFSSYGNTLDLVAPGDAITPVPIFSASDHTSAYASVSGTSFSSPLVAGVASLILSIKPDLTPSQIEYILTESTEKPLAMNDSAFTAEYGHGRLNAHRATLLAHAKTQDNLLGSRELSPHEPAIGATWRATAGLVMPDESILVGCRVFETAECSVTVENGNIYKFKQERFIKGDPVKYIFIKGSDVPSGSWKLSVHNQHYASFIKSLTK